MFAVFELLTPFRLMVFGINVGTENDVIRKTYPLKYTSWNLTIYMYILEHNKKNVNPCKPHFHYSKVGYTGYSLNLHVCMMWVSYMCELASWQCFQLQESWALYNY